MFSLWFAHHRADGTKLLAKKLAAHLPKMLAAGDQTQELVEQAMSANDEAASYTRELKETLCPEWWYTPNSSVKPPLYQSSTREK